VVHLWVGLENLAGIAKTMLTLSLSPIALDESPHLLQVLLPVYMLMTKSKMMFPKQ